MLIFGMSIFGVKSAHVDFVDVHVLGENAHVDFGINAHVDFWDVHFWGEKCTC